MAHTYGITEVVGSSTTSIDDAITTAVARASTTVRELDWFEVTNLGGKVDIHARCNGGGLSSQAGAIVMGLARALRRYDVGLEPALRAQGFMTRDSRMKERKKYGQRGARRKFQFSKR